MKILNSGLILSDGSFVFLQQANIKFLSVYGIQKKDLNNHFIWSQSSFLPQVEILTFVSRFNTTKKLKI